MIHRHIGKPLALSLDDAGRHPDDGGVGRDIFNDDGIRTDLDVVADFDAAENFGSGTDDHVIAQRRMPFPPLFPGAAERDALIDAHAVPDREGSYALPHGLDYARDVLEKAGMSRISAVESYWQQQIFAGKEVPPAAKPSDEEVLAYVRSTPGAIGYVSAGASTTGFIGTMRRRSDFLARSWVGTSW